MNGIEFSFLLLPSIAAVNIGWLVRHWTLGAAALAGGLGWLFLVPSLPGEARFLSPIFSGIAAAGGTMLVLLLVRRAASIWSRMTWALVVTFAAHFLFLITAMTSR